MVVDQCGCEFITQRLLQLSPADVTVESEAFSIELYFVELN